MHRVRVSDEATALDLERQFIERERPLYNRTPDIWRDVTLDPLVRKLLVDMLRRTWTYPWLPADPRHSLHGLDRMEHELVDYWHAGVIPGGEDDTQLKVALPWINGVHDPDDLAAALIETRPRGRTPIPGADAA
jgi:hypothetical protein